MTGGYFRVTSDNVKLYTYSASPSNYNFFVIKDGKKLVEYDEDSGSYNTTKLFISQFNYFGHPTEVIDSSFLAAIDGQLTIIDPADYPDIATDIDPTIIGELAIVTITGMD